MNTQALKKRKDPLRPAAVMMDATYDHEAGVWRDGQFWFDDRAADAAVGFFREHLCLTDAEWAGRPFILEPWQEHDIIRPAFGWKRADGTRRYRRIYVWVPRKNGKTELAAGVALLLLLGDGEIGGQVFSIAKDKDQATIVFSKATAMVRMSSNLSGELETFKTSIYHAPLNASFKPLSGRPTGKHGLSVSGLVGDEIHEWESGELYQFLHDSEGSRRQPMEFLISTAGQSGGYGEQAWNESQKILDGTIDDPETLVRIYAADQEDDWTDPAIWRKANPNLGISKKLEWMEGECRKAMQLPRLVNHFKNYQLNIWTDHATLWLPLSAKDDAGNDFGWDHCIGPTPWKQLDDRLAGLTCFGGLDLSAVSDLTALAWWFPVQPGLDVPTVLMRFWKPRGLLKQHSHRDRLPYEQWVRDGALFDTDKNAVDYRFIREQIYRDAERFKVAYAGEQNLEPWQGAIAIDRWNATETAIILREERLPVYNFGQGFGSMNAPSKDIEALVLTNGFHHGGHPILRQHAKVVAVETNATGDIKPYKKKITQRIDGIIAMVMAKGLSAGGLPKTHRSYLEDSDMEVL